jgi:hypothetical protein
MADFKFDVNAGESVTLLTAGKYCEDNIVVNAIGGAASNVHTVETDCANATVVVDYFRKLRPEGCTDMIVALKPPDGTTAFSSMENGQMLTLTLKGTNSAYTRWYSNALNVQTTVATSYTCKCWAGDEYYLIPLV